VAVRPKAGDGAGADLRLIPASGKQALEVRFHPFAREAAVAVVVARIVWDYNDGGRNTPRVLAEESLGKATGYSAMLAELRQIVAMAEPGGFERLQAAKSRFWTFLPIEDTTTAPA